MMHVNFDNIFIGTPDGAQSFSASFGEGINIIHGRNTSGKSTIINLIAYAFGINEVKSKLSEMIDIAAIVSIRFTLTQLGEARNCEVIRDGEFMFLNFGAGKFHRLTGVSGDNSAEHKKLKEMISNLLGFTLELDTKGVLHPAPIEAAFLPYFISQDVGWVYLRKSFSNLEFYRNFKEDFIDYYLGIISSRDRLKKYELERRKSRIQAEMETLISLGDSEEIKISQLDSEIQSSTLNEYINDFSDKNQEISALEKALIAKSNEASRIRDRKNILSRIKRISESILDASWKCPVCTQAIAVDLGLAYSTHQDVNDTESELEAAKKKLKELHGEVNSIKGRLEALRLDVQKRYSIIEKRTSNTYSLSSYFEMKSNFTLDIRIKTKLGSLSIEKAKVEDDLKGYVTDQEIEEKRQEKSRQFIKLLSSYLNELEVKPLPKERYSYLYSITSFPYQGVELLKAVMAYHFAFNEMIRQTESIHRLPFILDAIFKEDIEAKSKPVILAFIAKHAPSDTQTIMSIADVEGNDVIKDRISEKYFGGKAKHICIGESIRTRSILSQSSSDNLSRFREIVSIIDGTL